MLDQIRRKDELKRVNQKFGKPAGAAPAEVPGDDTVLLQKTTNLLDEAERALLGSPEDDGISSPSKDDSNLL